MSLATLQREVDGLPAAKRELVEDSIRGIGEAVLARAGELPALSDSWRSALVKSLTQVVKALLTQDPEQLQRLSDLLRDTPRVSQREADERSDLEAQNLFRVLAMAKQVEKQSMTAKQLRVSRQRLSQLRAEGKILGVKLPMHREFVYPRWQFDRAGRVLPVMPRLLDIAKDARLDGLDVHLLMTSNRLEGERPPADLLRKGDEDDRQYVLEVIRAGAGGLG